VVVKRLLFVNDVRKCKNSNAKLKQLVLFFMAVSIHNIEKVLPAVSTTFLFANLTGLFDYISKLLTRFFSDSEIKGTE
jgi:hypothetical protein